jgi:hypothetical protein
VGGLSFGLDGSPHLLGLLVLAIFVTWVVWHSLNWLVEKQLAASQVQPGNVLSSLICRSSDTRLFWSYLQLISRFCCRK